MQDNGDGIGPYNATASWGTDGAADSFTTFMDNKTYTSKMSAQEAEVWRLWSFVVIAVLALEELFANRRDDHVHKPRTVCVE